MSRGCRMRGQPQAARHHAGLHDGGCRDSRAGHRGEHGDVQRGQRRAPETAALWASRRPRGRVGAQPDPEPADQRGIPGNYLRWRDLESGFADMAAFTMTTGVTLTGGGEPEHVMAQYATAELFAVLGVLPMLGRPFTVDEDRGDRDVVVPSYRVWQRRFGGDPAILGRGITVSGRPHVVVGVMPAGFHIIDRSVELWMPTGFTAAARTPRGRYLYVLGRLGYRRHAGGRPGGHGESRPGTHASVPGVQHRLVRERGPAGPAAHRRVPSPALHAARRGNGSVLSSLAPTLPTSSSPARLSGTASSHWAPHLEPRASGWRGNCWSRRSSSHRSAPSRGWARLCPACTWCERRSPPAWRFPG